MDNQTAIGNVRSSRGTDPSDLEIASGGGARFVDRLQRLEDARAAAERATEAARTEQEALGYARGTKASNDLADERAAAARTALDVAKAEAARLVAEANKEVERRKSAAASAEAESAERAAAKMKDADEYAAQKRQEADADRAEAAAERAALVNSNLVLNRREAALQQREQEVGALERRAHESLADHKAFFEKYTLPVSATVPYVLGELRG